MSPLRGQACNSRPHYIYDFLTMNVQVECTPVLAFPVPGKSSGGTSWTYLTLRVDPVRSLLELGLLCSTWARSK